MVGPCGDKLEPQMLGMGIRVLALWISSVTWAASCSSHLQNRMVAGNINCVYTKSLLKRLDKSDLA